MKVLPRSIPDQDMRRASVSYPSLPGFNPDWIRNYFDSLELRRAGNWGKRSLRKPDQGKQDSPIESHGICWVIVKTWWLCARNRIMKREKKGLKRNVKFLLFFRIPLQTGLKTCLSRGSSTVYYFSIDKFFSLQLTSSERGNNNR